MGWSKRNFKWGPHQKKGQETRVFQIAIRDGGQIPPRGLEILLRKTFFSLGEGGLRRSDFDDLNLFQT